MSYIRKDKFRYYLDIALEISKRGTCIRRNYGSVIVNKDRIVSTGYSGAPRGAPNCKDIGLCPREEKELPQYSGYEICKSVHSEVNAIIHANYDEMIDGAIYIAGFHDDAGGGELMNVMPCSMCSRIIINAGLAKVIVRRIHNGQEGLRIIDVSAFVRCGYEEVVAQDERAKLEVLPGLKDDD